MLHYYNDSRIAQEKEIVNSFYKIFTENLDFFEIRYKKQVKCYKVINFY